MLRLHQSDEEIPILNFPSLHLTQSGLNIWGMPVKVENKGGETSVKFLRHTCGICIFDMLYKHTARREYLFINWYG